MNKAGVEIVNVRSPLVCKTKHGICSACYGRDLATGRRINVGEAIGVIAAQSIGEPGTQLTMRTFHFGGAVSHKVEKSNVESHLSGVVKLKNCKMVRNREGRLIVLSRNGEVQILEPGTENIRVTYPIPYGSILFVEEGQELEAGSTVAEWDSFAVSIIANSDGKARYVDLEEGRSLEEKIDEITFLTRKVVIESKGTALKPSIQVVEGDSESEKDVKYPLPTGAIIFVDDGAEIKAGDILAKIPRSVSKTKDITGGLPRVAELFEARKPKDVAILSEIDGEVSFGADTKGKRKVIVTAEDGEQREYLVPKARHVLVTDGDYVRKGEAIVDGAQNPHDILSIMGVIPLSRYLVDEVQAIYKLQGVKINDKHIEIIVRQMLRRVRILESGDSKFLPGEQVERAEIEDINEALTAQGKEPATYEPLLLGITKASLSTESFISAASFQETTKVLTEAAINSKVDYLRGLKENVTMGRLIPAGTGNSVYHNLKSKVNQAETGGDVA